MINFSTWLLFEETEQIKPKSVYTYAFLAYHRNTITRDKYLSERTKEFLSNLKDNYLQAFTPIVVDQIQKYLDRGRVDSDVNISKVPSGKVSTAYLKKLSDLMKKTYRSDMKRRNDRWNLFTDNLLALSKASSLKDLYFYIDRIHNDIHNTGEFILSKYRYDLQSALEDIHQARTPKDFVHRVARSFIADFKQLGISIT